jgi:predicted amidophosphoribosyltransferase
VRLVTGGVQVLLCPDCQAADPLWRDRSDHCPACGSTRLSVMLGSVVCRACGEIQAEDQASE